MYRAFRPILLLLSLALDLACSSGSDDGGPRTPADILLSPEQPVLGQGLSLKLTATVVDKDGRSIPGLQVTFRSSDIAMLTVDGLGNLHSLGATGIAFVTAEHNGLTRTITVQVTRRFVGLFVSPESLVINIGLSRQLGAALLDYEGVQYLITPVSYQSQDAAVATVDPAGNVLAGGTPGQTTIRVGIDTFSRIVPVRVGQIADRMSATPPNVVLASGGTQQLAVSVLDQAGTPIPSPTLLYASSAPTVFTVSSTGLVTSVGPAGSGAVQVRFDTLELAVPVLVSGAAPVSLAHTTPTGVAMYEAALGPAGEMIISSPSGEKVFRGTLPSFDLPIGVPTGTLPLGVALSHDGTRGYVASGDGLTVLDLTSNTALSPIPLPGCGDKQSVVVSGDDQRAYIGGTECIYVVDLVSRQVTDSVVLGVSTFLAIHPTQPLLYLGEGLVREINLTTKAIRTFAETEGIQGIAVSPDGSELYGADAAAGVLRVFSTATGEVIQTVPVAEDVFGLAASDKWIVITTNVGVAVFDRPSRFLLSMVPVGGLPRRPAIDRAQTTIVVPNEDGWVDFIQ